MASVRTPPPHLLSVGERIQRLFDGPSIIVEVVEEDRDDPIVPVLTLQNLSALPTTAGEEPDSPPKTTPEGSEEIRHTLVAEYIPKPTFCALDSCRAFIWGLTHAQQHAKVCKGCGLAAHGRCAEEFAKRVCSGNFKDVITSTSIPLPSEILQKWSQGGTVLVPKIQVAQSSVTKGTTWEFAAGGPGTATLEVRGEGRLLERLVFLVS